jgi:hypothetical protein
LVRPGLEAFFEEQCAAHVDLLLRALRQKDRDTMKEAAIAGKIDAYETALSELQHFATRQIKEASE